MRSFPQTLFRVLFTPAVMRRTTISFAVKRRTRFMPIVMTLLSIMVKSDFCTLIISHNILYPTTCYDILGGDIRGAL